MAQVIDGYSQHLSHSIHLVYFQCSCWSVVFYRKPTPALSYMADTGLKSLYYYFTELSVVLGVCNISGLTYKGYLTFSLAPSQIR